MPAVQATSAMLTSSARGVALRRNLGARCMSLCPYALSAPGIAALAARQRPAAPPEHPRFAR